MSYILDALKKLEHDKSRKSRRDGMINISGALFENERPRPSGPAVWKIVLVVTVAVLVTFGVTWLLLRPARGRVKPATRVSPAPAVPQTPPVSAPPPVPVVVPVQQTPPPAISAPAQITPVRSPASPSAAQKAGLQAAPATDDDVDEDPQTRRRRKRLQGQILPARQTTAAPASQDGAAPADIKLSGIAWQEERRARRAVVNGFLMQEGAVVSGARITDIFQDRVRFSLSGKTFEIPLISSAVPSDGK